jgi:hypothetical protein
MDKDENVGSTSFAKGIPGYKYEYVRCDDEITDYERLSRWREKWGVVRHDDRWRWVKEEPHE